MTAQSPERIILDGRPRALYAEPLYRLLASRRMDFRSFGDCHSTSCYRNYVGTWQITAGSLYLVHLNLMAADEQPLPLEAQQRLFRAVPCSGFPIKAHWYNGALRVATGRRLVYSHHGWSHWFERERVFTVIDGVVKRDREVNTAAILKRQLERNPEMRDWIEGDKDSSTLGPLIWFDDDDEDWVADWWPLDYRPDAATAGRGSVTEP